MTPEQGYMIQYRSFGSLTWDDDPDGIVYATVEEARVVGYNMTPSYRAFRVVRGGIVVYS